MTATAAQSDDAPFLRRTWRAASRPRRFFDRLACADAAAMRPALTAALLAWTCAFTVAGLAAARLTGSDVLPWLLAGALFGAGKALAVLLLFGAAALWLGRIDLRAIEVAGWSSSPALYTAVSLLPAAWLAPGAALAVGVPVALLWHLAVARHGLLSFRATRTTGTLALYVATMHGLPLFVGAYLVALLGDIGT